MKVGDLVKCKGDSPFLPGIGIVIGSEVCSPSRLETSVQIHRQTVFWFDEQTSWTVSSSELEILTEK